MEIKLATRQLEVMRLICERGFSDKEIAAELRISTGTSKLHLRLLLKAVGVRSRIELVIWFYKNKSNELAAKAESRSSRQTQIPHTRCK